MDSVDPAALDDWAPVWIRTGSEPVVDWAIVRAPFTAPFFEQTADAAMRHPFNQLFARETGFDVLRRTGAGGDPPAPRGLIFHMSRCGSTLVAQMLAALPGTIVLSEVQPVDAVLTLHRNGRLGDQAAIDALRGLAGALGRPRRGETRLFVKFHASHIADLPLIARAFPGTPWVFLFREPSAVLSSHARTLGAEAFAAAHGIVPDERTAADAVAAYCEAALRHAELGRSLFVDYAQMPQAVFETIFPFFGVRLGEDEAAAVSAAARRDTKRPGEFERRDGATDRARFDRLALPRLAPAYTALRARAEAG